MATNAYMTGRRKYSRPQAMLWSDNPGTLEEGIYAPLGYEVGASLIGVDDLSLINQFIVLSDDNRAPLDIRTQRLEKRERTINGRMRSYHIADKLTISTSWNMLPSRAFKEEPLFNNSTGKPGNLVTETIGSEGELVPTQPYGSPYLDDQQYTTDGGAGGVEILDWYNNHKGPFWVFLAYDNYVNRGRRDRLDQYNQVIQMYISDFSYSVQSRGASNHDFWNISVTLEEV